MRLCPHCHDLDAVRCLACHVEALRGVKLGTISVADHAVPKTADALDYIRGRVAQAFRVPAHLLMGSTIPRTRRCWQCAALGLVVEAVAGDIYCEGHREAVAQAVEEMRDDGG